MHGCGGVGKTTAAIMYAKSFLAAKGARRYWINCNSRADFEGKLHRLANELGFGYQIDF